MTPRLKYCSAIAGIVFAVLFVFCRPEHRQGIHLARNMSEKFPLNILCIYYCPTDSNNTPIFVLDLSYVDAAEVQERDCFIQNIAPVVRVASHVEFKEVDDGRIAVEIHGLAIQDVVRCYPSPAGRKVVDDAIKNDVNLVTYYYEPSHNIRINGEVVTVWEAYQRHCLSSCSVQKSIR